MLAKIEESGTRKKLLVAVVVLLWAVVAGAQIRSVTAPGAAAPANRFFSPAVDAGGYVYISAQGPRRPDGSLPATFGEQVRQALENVRTLVQAAGLTMNHVVYTQVYLDHIEKYEEMDHAFGEYFPQTPPARAVLGVARVPDPPLAITAVAVRDLTGRRAIIPPDSKSSGTASPGILTQDRLFISGMTGRDSASGKTPEDAAAEVDLALDRMQAVLKSASLDMANMVFVNPYLTSEMSHRVMNQRYARRFEFGNTPARATIDVVSLPGGAHIEYTGVAVRDLSQRKAVRPKNMPPSPTASPCVFAGATLYCSAKDGFIPGPHGGLYATSTQHQLRQTMRNLLDNLEEADMSFDEVVSTNIYLDNLSDQGVFDPIYAEYFGPVMPASTTVQQIAPGERKPDREDHFPGLEQVSLIAVKHPAK